MSLIQCAHHNHIMIVTFNNPDKLNILSRSFVKELNEALDTYEADTNSRCLILAATGKAFSGGADIHEIQDLTAQQVQQDDFVNAWQRLNQCQKPVIAEVGGYCLGGGLELALMCDLIIASEAARFGQPEITLATLPGSGGTQRLAAILGKNRAMELCLTGRHLTAEEALAWGLINQCVTPEQLRAKSLMIAEKIASFSQPVVRRVKSLVQSVSENALTEGLKEERRLFQETFDLADQKEGFAAFLEHRPPQFKDG